MQLMGLTYIVYDQTVFYKAQNLECLGKLVSSEFFMNASVPNAVATLTSFRRR